MAAPHSYSFTRSALGRHILAWLLLVLAASSAIFLVLFVSLYKERLLAEHVRASVQVNELFEVALKNAMLKRDIPGLQHIVAELGKSEDIADVFIINPQGEVRFSSTTGMIGNNFSQAASAAAASGKPAWSLARGSGGLDVLRTVNPVHNEPQCLPCHGSVAEHPINGLLIVDYKASDLQLSAMRGAGLLAAAGSAVLSLSLLAVALVFGRRVLRPITMLGSAARQLTDGDYSARSQLASKDEFGSLGKQFDTLAETIEDKVRGLERGEAFLQHVIDAVPDGVRVIGPDYSILKVNAAYCRQLGISPADALGRPCYASSHHLDTPCSASLVTCPMEELRGGKRQEISCVHRHLRRDGSELFVEVHAAVAALGEGGDHCIVESIRDLSNQAEASHQQRLSEIGQLAAGIAHEIHNPLWSIQLALSSLRSDLAQAKSREATESYIDIATAEIDRCLNVSRRLLHISEPAQQEPTLLDIGNTIHEVVSLVGYQAEMAGVAKRVSIEGQPRIIAAESDFGIVILNLVQNAIHAMPDGGDLNVSAHTRDGKVVLTVSDTGIGISAENLNRIFWPFWSKRADNSSGSGLGLSICKATVERMGGSIAVRSKQGSGTVFTVLLPDADRQGEAA